MPFMPSKSARPTAYLFHIRDNITLAASFVAGFGYEAFRDNQLVFCAVTWALEIISEASRRLPAEMKKRHPHIPWTDVAGAGSVYRHDFEDVRNARSGTPCTIICPPLLAVVEHELRELGELA